MFLRVHDLGKTVLNLVPKFSWAGGSMQILLLAGEGSSSVAFVIPVVFRISSSSSSSIHVDAAPDQRL